MNGLIFFITALTLIILIIITLVAVARHRRIKRKIVAIATIFIAYTAVWLFFYFKAQLVTVPLGTYVCFDDWCITVNQVDKSLDSSTITLQLTMSNHARGIAQTPDEPRIHLVDDKGTLYNPMQTFPLPLNVRLQLHQSLQTNCKFVVPKTAGSLYALIEEGPFIAHLVFPEDQQVFRIR